VFDDFNQVDAVKARRLKRQETIEIDAADPGNAIGHQPGDAIVSSDHLEAQLGQHLGRVAAATA
jgi:hypothetical protein